MTKNFIERFKLKFNTHLVIVYEKGFILINGIKNLIEIKIGFKIKFFPFKILHLFV